MDYSEKKFYFMRNSFRAHCEASVLEIFFELVSAWKLF